jgi:hypothetical protein
MAITAACQIAVPVLFVTAGRTLWMVGDSMIMRVHFALQCFLLELWDATSQCRISRDPEVSRRIK